MKIECRNQVFCTPLLLNLIYSKAFLTIFRPIWLKLYSSSKATWSKWCIFIIKFAKVWCNSQNMAPLWAIEKSSKKKLFNPTQYLGVSMYPRIRKSSIPSPRKGFFGKIFFYLSYPHISRILGKFLGFFITTFESMTVFRRKVLTK